MPSCALHAYRVKGIAPAPEHHHELRIARPDRSMTMADRIVVMHDGGVGTDGAPLQTSTLRQADQSVRGGLHRRTGDEFIDRICGAEGKFGGLETPQGERLAIGSRSKRVGGPRGVYGIQAPSISIARRRWHSGGRCGRRADGLGDADLRRHSFVGISWACIPSIAPYQSGSGSIWAAANKRLLTCRTRRPAPESLEHDPEKGRPVFGKDMLTTRERQTFNPIQSNRILGVPTSKWRKEAHVQQGARSQGHSKGKAMLRRSRQARRSPTTSCHPWAKRLGADRALEGRRTEPSSSAALESGSWKGRGSGVRGHGAGLHQGDRMSRQRTNDVYEDVNRKYRSPRILGGPRHCVGPLFPAPSLSAKKCLDVSGSRQHLGKKYGGLGALGGRLRKTKGKWIAIPVAVTAPSSIPISAEEKGRFKEGLRRDTGAFLELPGTKHNNTPARLRDRDIRGPTERHTGALGVWAHGGLPCRQGPTKVIINSPETAKALEYVKRSTRTFYSRHRLPGTDASKTRPSWQA